MEAQRVDRPTAAPAPRQVSELLRRHGIFVGLGCLVVLNVIITPHFWAWTTLRLQLQQVTPLVFTSLGMAFVVATKGIDISVGAVMAVASVVAALAIGPLGWPVAVLLALGSAAACGLLNGSLVAFLRIQPIVATLGFLVAGRGLASVIVDGKSKSLYDDTFISFGRRYFELPFGASVPLAAVVWVALSLAIWWLVRSTRFGFLVRAAGANPVAAGLSGQRVRRTTVSVYVISGVLAGIAGMYVTALAANSDATQVGLLMELDAIAAVVVGGTTLQGGELSVPRTVAGANFVLLTETTLLRNNVDTALTQLISGLIILAAVFVAARISRRSERM
ncbi:MAG: ABC transporter permease [bacterium]|nr:ABC transporter permease [bacterium]